MKLQKIFVNNVSQIMENMNNKCYHKSEKMNNLYYDSSSQRWKECETNKDSFICSICPKGTYIKDPSSGICEKCPIGEYNNNEDSNKCEKCPKGYYSNVLGASNCEECPKGTFNSLMGNDHCEQCDGGFFNDELGSEKCKKCSPNFYSDEKGSLYCKECEENKYSLFGYTKCLPCEQTILNCNKCSKEGKCLECKNKAVSGFDNCKICENNIDWNYKEEYCQLITICPKYYYKNKYNNNKIICIEDITECPKDMDYLNLDTGECKEKIFRNDFADNAYKVKGGEELLEEVSNNIIFEYVDFYEFFEEFLRKNKIKIKGINSNLQIGLEDNLKNPDDSDIGVDLGDCPEKLRIKYEIKNADDIIYKVYEITLNGTKIVKWNAYNIEDLEKPLDLSPCQNQKIKILSPPLKNYFEDYEEFQKFNKIIKDGINIYDAYSPIYNNSCIPLTVLDKYDMTLNDRREYITKKNIFLCEEGCEYEGENVELFQVICYCKIKDNKEDISLNQLINGTIDLKYRHNFAVLKCYDLTFSILGQDKNYCFYIFIIFFLINIFLIIINEVYLKDILNDLIKYCKEYIDKNNKEKEFNILRDIYLGIKKDEETIKKLKRCVNERILNSPPKRNIIDKKENSDKKNNEESNEKIRLPNEKSNEKKKLPPINHKRSVVNNIYNKIKRIKQKYIKINFFNKLLLYNKKKIDAIKENDKYYKYYIFLIYAYLKKGRKNYLIEDELNDLDYEYYRNIEDRKWYKIYWSVFKSKYDFINTFFIFNKYKDFRFYWIKIMIYINSIIISIIVNIAFFWDDTMHKIYEDDGEYNILYRLPKIFISDLIMNIISYIFVGLIDYQGNFVELKNNLNKNINNNDIKNNDIKNNDIKIIDNENNKNFYQPEITEEELITKKKNNILELIKNKKNEKNEKIELGNKIRKSFLINRIIFYIIIIILNIFNWYYASCFCAVYKKTQKHIFFDFLYGIPINLISCLLACIINIILRILIIKGNYSCFRKYFFTIINYSLISFIIEKLIEFVIIKLIESYIADKS